MLDRNRLSEIVKVKVTEVIPSCIHHWLVSADAAVPLRGRQALNHPDCIGRRSICKKCGKSQIKPERVF